MSPRLAPVLLAALLAACAQTPPKAPVAPELFAVIPGANGHVGAIVVEGPGKRQVLDTAYEAARIRADGTTENTRLSEAEIRAQFAAVLDALPGRPASFVLHFLEGRDELTPASKAELDKVFAEIKRRPLPDIVVIGHTDTVGGLAYNDRLSLARAERLRDMLIELGIAAERVRAAGRGKRELLVPTEDNVPEPRNRRVEINVR